jgi:hypothetical protein
MKPKVSDQQLRMRDFNARARDAPEAGFEDPSVGEYIAVNPLADEVDLLDRLGISPSQCTKVDCYWKRGGDVCFLQVETRANTSREPGLWARTSAGNPPYVNLVAIVEESFVTRQLLHRVMNALSEFEIDRIQLGTNLERLKEA